MQNRIRSLVFLVAALYLASAYVFTATQSTVPKYASGGSFVDSAIAEVSGNVGIGTTSPAEDLHIAAADNPRLLFTRGGMNNVLVGDTGGANDGGVFLYDSTGNNDVLLRADGNSFFNGGNVGVGTTNPSARLHVNGLVQLEENLEFRAGGSRGRLTHSSTEFSMRGGTGQAISLGSNNSANQLYITTAGNVGIGTASPSARLHVNGNVTVDGNLGAKYQDVAEWVDASEPATAGTVVSADPDQGNHVRLSRRAYDTAVSGVVSRQPGLLLGEAGAGKVIVAQSGRVRVKADATFGAITPGDLLVTSAVPGYAMRSEPLLIGDAELHRPGTIIGKALESLRDGRGEVLTLLTLQ
jgi:hypothetical protein